MGKKVFISYKYGDMQVQNINRNFWTTARNYVDEIQDLLTAEDHINKGENDGESMDSLADSTIGSKLGDKIFDSTVTIVLISKGMKENKPEKDQWIPWEISYSLKEQSRNGLSSKTNAVLAVVLPDEYGSYSYFWNFDNFCNCTNYETLSLFEILRKNMFNIKNPEIRDCAGKKVYNGYCSYIYSVEWGKFKDDINKYIEIAVTIMKNRHLYEIKKNI